MADLPTGAVTFLFTYIEGSTPLWEQHPEAMRHALAHHDALLHRTIEARHGHVFKTMGDSFCAAFTTPEEAVQVAAEAQRALQRELPELRVRMAIYTGDAELRGGDYFGPALNRVSRLLAAGHGGQVLLSQTAVQQLRSSSPNGHDLRPLGEHRLRDLTSKEAIFQLVLPGLPSTFPPLNTLDVAFRRGMRRAALLSAVVLAVMAGLVITALDQAQRAKEQRQVALQGQRLLRQHLYAAQMNQAQQAWDEGNLGRAFELLEKQRPDRSGEEDLRGFEWRCLWRLCQGESWFTLALPGSPNLYNWLAFSPNGRLLAIGGQESIALWRVSPQQRSAVLEGSLPGNFVLAFSPDGKMLAVRSRPASGKPFSITVWDLGTRREVATLQGHTGDITTMAFSPDSRVLATGSDDHTVRLWDIGSRRDLSVLEAHRAVVYAVAFSPDGKTLVTGGRDDTVRFWDLPSRRLKDTLDIGAVVSSVAFSPDGKLLATGDWAGTLRLWDPTTRREIAPLPETAGMVHSVQFSPDGRQLAAASADQTVKLWDIGTRRPITSLRGHRHEVWVATFSPDGKTLASGSMDGTVRLWDAAPRQEDAALKKRIGSVDLVALAPDHHTLATCKSSRREPFRITLWDLMTGERKAVLSGYEGIIRRMLFSRDGRFLVTSGAFRNEAFIDPHPRVLLWDLDQRKPAVSFEGQDLALSPDGRTLATVTDRHIVRLWDTSSRRPMGLLKTPSIHIWSLAFSPDGKILATGGDGGVLHLWELNGRPTPRLLKGYRTPALCLAFSPDGKRLAAGYMDNTIRLWNAVSGAELAELRGHTQWVESVAFSPDGKTLASASRIVKLWNVATALEVGAYRGKLSQARSVAFSPDGSLLAAAGLDRTISLWRAPTFAEIEAQKDKGLLRSSR